MAQPNFGKEQAALLLAVRGGAPAREDYEASIALVAGYTGSANHKMQSNPTEALEGIRTGKLSRAHAVLEWAEGYLEQPLHENEALTPNVAYRPAITQGTYALAGIAAEVGRDELATALLARCRADIFWILLGAATGPAREIVDHHTDNVGEAFLYVGGGPKESPVPGLQYFAQAGKRGHVRAGGHGNHVEEIEDTLGMGISALVSFATGIGAPKRKDLGDLYRAMRARWPRLEPFGLSDADRLLAKMFLADPLDVANARQVAMIAATCRPELPFAFIRYADGSVASVCWESTDSSTGCRQADVWRADGWHFIASADTGSRGTKGNPGAHVQPQICTETPTDFVCRWKSGQGKTIVAPKPAAAEVYRLETRRSDATFTVAGEAQQPPSQPDISGNPTIPLPAEPQEGSLRLNLRAMTAAECAATGSALGSFLLSANSAEATVKEIWPGAGADEARRWVIEP